ncbi:DinB family protein [Confluentibacter sediminis]|uniref:DinB family protein n=1 Tax=Confluentibacter sediminis TaxID=2219045 RepID=UPI000DABB0E4|nr:DinB family protein [Confluentibacter sediminis]
MDFIFEVLPNTRKYFNSVLENNSLEDLNKIPKGYNNNIIWNVAHIIVAQQILVYKLSGLPIMLSDEFVEKYKKGSKPEAPVSQKEVEEIKALLFPTVQKTQEDYANGVFQNYHEYTVVTTGNTLKNVNDALQFNLFHEGLHMGYIMSLLRAIKI